MVATKENPRHLQRSLEARVMNLTTRTRAFLRCPRQAGTCNSKNGNRFLWE